MPNFPVDPPRSPVGNQVTVYHAQPNSHRDPLGRVVEPDFFVDVTDLVDRKIEMLSCHVSQKKWLDESQGHESYLQTLRDLDEELGACRACSSMLRAGGGIFISAFVVPGTIRCAMR